jgi:predicted signal transduction protein with EAL and GGDEF domain
VDIIKVDPSFVAGLGQDPTLAMLTRTIVRVGHDLGIEIVAEGIEQPEQLELLREMGCGLGQGYLIARPMTAVEVAARARNEMVPSGAHRDPAPAGAAGLAGGSGSAGASGSAGDPCMPGGPSPGKQDQSHFPAA